MTQLPLNRPRRRPGVVLALDLGTKLGFALGEATSQGEMRYRSGMAKFADDESDHPGQRWIRLWSHLDKLHEEYGPVAVAVLEDFVGGLRTADSGKQFSSRAPIVYGSLRSIVEAWACNWKIPVLTVNPSTLKKAATGNGRAKKPEMRAAAARRWSIVEVADDNHADALCILGCWLDGMI